MNALTDKLDRVKDSHAEAELVDIQTAHDDKATADAMFFLGRIKQNDHIAVAISTNLTAQTVRALEHFQQEKQFEILGYNTFVDFLDKSPYAPMTKRQYYDRLALVREHGDEIYDLLTSVGISVRAQKLLGKGDLAIKGDKLMIGDTEVEVANTGVIKEVLEELFDEKRELTTKLEKAEKKVADRDETIAQGQDDFDELRRNYDKLLDGDPFDRSVSFTVRSFLELEEHIGDLSDKAKKKKAEQTLGVLWTLLQRLRASFGSQAAFVEGATDPAADSFIAEAFKDDDDFGDQTEAPH